MESKITIDYGHDYKPLIRIKRARSEDVRDKMVNSFFDEWGTHSNLLFMAHHNSSGPHREYTISPMPLEKVIAVMGEELLQLVSPTEETFSKVKEFFEWINNEIDSKNGVTIVPATGSISFANGAKITGTTNGGLNIQSTPTKGE